MHSFMWKLRHRFEFPSIAHFNGLWCEHPMMEGTNKRSFAPDGTLDLSGNMAPALKRWAIAKERADCLSFQV